MPRPRPLPAALGDAFHVREAFDAGVSRQRLSRSDLASPFHGIRTTGRADAVAADPYARQAAARREGARIYWHRLRRGQFFSHETAAALWRAPVPLLFHERRIAQPTETPLHVSTLGDGPLVRTAGVTGHRARPLTTCLASIDGMPVSSPATTWASLGRLPLIDLVALGDYFCRAWRVGHGRPSAGTPPLATPDDLRRAIAAGRRVGIRRLREAIDLVREDSWSPRESAVRCHLVLAGLPEPRLNHDVYSHGRFIACVDLAYPERKVAIEYQSLIHADRYAADVERIAALRAAGWTVIEVTSSLFAAPDVLVARVRAALRR